jgi:hypothetical protein
LSAITKTLAAGNLSTVTRPSAAIFTTFAAAGTSTKIATRTAAESAAALSRIARGACTRRWIGRSGVARRSVRPRTRRLSERAAVSANLATGCAATAVWTALAIIPTWTIIAPHLARGRFVLGPLGAEAEPLELSEIEFVEILGRIF